MYGQDMLVGSSQLKSAEVPRPRTDIENAFSRLNEELSIAEKGVEQLKEKLRPVMSEVPQDKDDKGEGYCGSPMAQEIEQKTQRIRYFNKELVFILDSLQL